MAPLYPPPDTAAYVVWIVDNPDYTQPMTFTSTSFSDSYVIYSKKEVKIHREYPDYLNLSRNFRGCVERPLKVKAQPQYARKHCSQHDRRVNKRKAFIQLCHTRKFMRYLNYLRKR